MFNKDLFKLRQTLVLSSGKKAFVIIVFLLSHQNPGPGIDSIKRKLSLETSPWQGGWGSPAS